MKAYFNLYRPRMVKVLSYMLQSMEYDPIQYLRWFWHQRDFGRLKSKLIKPTTKSRLLEVLCGLLYLSLVSYGAWLWYSWAISPEAPALILAIGVTALLPILLAHLLIAPLFVGTWLVQRPIEWLGQRGTKRIFADSSAKVIVIAGSYGKTSMKHLIKSVLGAKLKVAVTPGNYNTPAGIGRFARKLDGDEDVLVVEAGEYRPGDVAKICRLAGPDIGFITGVNEQHMTRMKSVDNALRSAFELAESLAEGAPLYINAESEYLVDQIAKTDLAYSREGVGKLKVSKLSTGLGGTKLTIKPAKGKSYQLTTSLIGLHQAGPIAAVCYLAADMGLKPADIKKGVKSHEAFSRRFNPQDINGVTLIDDSYNGNPDGFLAGIDFLDELSRTKRRVYVTPGMTELGWLTRDVHFAIGQRLAKSKIKLVILNENPATKQIAAGLEDGKYKGDINWLGELDNFLEHVEDLTKPGDVVLMQNSPREAFFYL